MSNKILLFSGDPKSINSEIIFKTWKSLSNSMRKKIYIISNYDLLKKQFKKLKYSAKITKVKNIDDLPNCNKIKILNLKLKFKNPFEVSQKSTSRFIINGLTYAHKLSLNKKVAGFINCPINKNLLGEKNIGVTEFFAKKCKVKKDTEVMLISNEKFSVSPLTTHIDLKKVAKKISSKLIFKKIKTINSWLKNKKRKRPKICILGLNPHNAELRDNSEEKRIIYPALNKLKRIGINIKGPFPADTIFINEYKNYDVVIGMYHDQVIAPFKTLFKFDAINITLGLKYLRVSPDHGVALSLIGKNKANPKSLMKCIKFINKF